MTSFARIVLVVVVCVSSSACSTLVRLDENLADYRVEVYELQRAVLADPQDVESLRDLGVIYVRTGYAQEGRANLLKAYEHGDRDPRSMLFLGLAHEALNEPREALPLYETYADTPRQSSYRRLLEGRYTWLSRDLARADIRLRLTEEATIGDEEASEDVVAVFPLAYQGTNPRYEPLGRGLAEMIMVDLQQVNNLRIVERVRLQALRDELAFAASDYVDQSTAPRMGRLLQAGRVVSGAYNVLSDQDLRLDAAVVESNTATVSDLTSETDALDAFFAVEKRIVFGLLDELGYLLTEAERRRIEEIPTQNLQAFLAFSRGLQAEDAQDYGAAAALYQQAGQLDPSFGAATSRSEGASNSARGAGPRDDVLSSAKRLDPFRHSPIDLLGHRNRQLGVGIASPLLPGADKRKPAAEPASGPPGQTATLPDPPRPPGGGA